MIFVTLGTQDKTFVRLLKEIDNLIKKDIIKSKVIVQSGATKYTSDNMKIFDFIAMDEFSKYIEECDLLITHGGVGSIIAGLDHHKKVIAVPRLKKYIEHENDHQIQIINEFAKDGFIIGCMQVEDLQSCLENAKDFNMKIYKSNAEHFRNLIMDIIEKI